MHIRVAINGFGRIGRNTFKSGFGRLDAFDVVAINDLTDTKTLAHLLRHDTSYGLYEHEVSYDAQHIIVNGKKMRVYAEKDPAQLPWKKEKIDVVLECTGRFTDTESASAHIKAGAKRVIISAPAKDGTAPTHVLGVNGEDYDGKALVINNASCTTNCISPVAAVMAEKFGVKKAMMTTIHGYTADQNLQDGPHKDLRRARAAAANIVPTTTGAAIATTEVIPELKGLFDGLSMRVPVAVVSLSDFTFLLKKNVTVEQVNNALKSASKQARFHGVLACTEEELVSSDLIKNPNSAIVDLGLTRVVDGDMVKVVAWYDNEWGYSSRLAEMALVVGNAL
jgi:glyceraldehyde 3-phosphate dehydrogenase